MASHDTVTVDGYMVSLLERTVLNPSLMYGAGRWALQSVSTGVLYLPRDTSGDIAVAPGGEYTTVQLQAPSMARRPSKKAVQPSTTVTPSTSVPNKKKRAESPPGKTSPVVRPSVAPTTLSHTVPTIPPQTLPAPAPAPVPQADVHTEKHNKEKRDRRKEKKDRHKGNDTMSPRATASNPAPPPVPTVLTTPSSVEKKDKKERKRSRIAPPQSSTDDSSGDDRALPLVARAR